MRMQQEVQVEEYRLAEETPQRWRQPKGEDRTEMKKEARVFEVHFAQWIVLEYRVENLRTLESIQKRGRCKSGTSVRRCEKRGRVHQSWSELAP